jgi:hypothetical protein
MAYATLEVLAGRVREDLERLLQGRRAVLAEHLRQLLHLLVTADVPEPLGDLAESGQARGLWTHLRALSRYLQDESRLPEALCARYKYKVSESKATKRYQVTPRTWDYVHGLAKELTWDPDLHIPLIPYENHGWHDELEEEFVNVEVVLDSRALEGMLICALEGYLSPRKPRRKGYEVYGINLGMARDVHRQRHRGGISITRYVSVMRSHPQLSAEGHTTFVESNPRSLDAILSATAAFYPQYLAVGDFHSHPYDDLATLVRRRGWEYSQSDEESNVTLIQAMSELGHHVLVSFVLAIARSGQKVARSHFRGLRYTIQMSLGNCRAILGAYRSLGSGHLTKRNIGLRLSGTTG